MIEVTYLVCTCMPGESYRWQLRSVLCLCDVSRALIKFQVLILNRRSGPRFWFKLLFKHFLRLIDWLCVDSCGSRQGVAFCLYSHHDRCVSRVCTLLYYVYTLLYYVYTLLYYVCTLLYYVCTLLYYVCTFFVCTLLYYVCTLLYYVYTLLYYVRTLLYYVCIMLDLVNIFLSPLLSSL